MEALCLCLGACVPLIPEYGGAAIAWLVTHHRWFVVLVFMMPLSLVVNTLFYLNSTIQFAWSRWTGAGEEMHIKRVKIVQDAIDAWRDAGANTKLTSSRPGWATMSLRVGNYKATSTKIPVMHLNNVVNVDLEKMTVKCEPMVTMGQVTHTLNKLGLTLPVVPELDDLTVGGLTCGVGIETSSHREGLFYHTCVSYEIVTADGKHLRCSKDENVDYFKAIPWSHGTLGILVGVEIQIVTCKPWVKLEYEPYHDKEAAIQACAEAFDSDIDFVEALVYGKGEWVLMKGTMVDVPVPEMVNAIGNYWKPWFFTHVAEYLKTGEGTEYIPLRDYYHRHTRSLFWEIQDIVTFGNQAWFRYLFGWMMPPNISIMKRLQTEELRKLYELHHVVQDMLIPMSTLSKGMSVMDQHFDIYPIWICPMRIFKEDAGFVHPARDGEEMYVDVGIYGVPGVGSGRPGKTDFVAEPSCRAVEDFVREVDGFQMLYADMYQTEEEFREMFDHTLLDKLRDAVPMARTAFPDVYNKVCKSART
jgi:delta24-sterol reductase